MPKFKSDTNGTKSGKSSEGFQQEKPTNCGTKAADVLANFYPANFNASPLNMTTTLTSQRLSIQSVAPSATV